jgi:hypothetical protein
MPHTLRRIDTGDEVFAELDVLIGCNDLAAESARVSNRIRGLLTQIHPTLEQVLCLLRRALASSRRREPRPLTPPPETITDPHRLAHLNIHRNYRLDGILHEYEHAV